MAYKVILSPPARRDLTDIRTYIAGDNPEAAKRFCRNLLLEAQTLSIFPNRGQRFARSKARQVVYRSYLIVYEIDEALNRVKILRFWHAAQDSRHLRLKEEAPGYVLATNLVS